MDWDKYILFYDTALSKYIDEKLWQKYLAILSALEQDEGFEKFKSDMIGSQNNYQSKKSNEEIIAMAEEIAKKDLENQNKLRKEVDK